MPMWLLNTQTQVSGTQVFDKVHLFLNSAVRIPFGFKKGGLGKWPEPEF